MGVHYDMNTLCFAMPNPFVLTNKICLNQYIMFATEAEHKDAFKLMLQQ